MGAITGFLTLTLLLVDSKTFLSSLIFGLASTFRSEPSSIFLCSPIFFAVGSSFVDASLETLLLLLLGLWAKESLFEAGFPVEGKLAKSNSSCSSSSSIFFVLLLFFFSLQMDYTSNVACYFCIVFLTGVSLSLPIMSPDPRGESITEELSMDIFFLPLAFFKLLKTLLLLLLEEEEEAELDRTLRDGAGILREMGGA